MTEWSDWNYINVFFVFFSAVVAYTCFKDDNDNAGWINIFASAVNLAIIGAKLL